MDWHLQARKTEQRSPTQQRAGLDSKSVITTLMISPVWESPRKMSMATQSTSSAFSCWQLTTWTHPKPEMPMQLMYRGHGVTCRTEAKIWGLLNWPHHQQERPWSPVWQRRNLRSSISQTWSIRVLSPRWFSTRLWARGKTTMKQFSRPTYQPTHLTWLSMT